MLKRNTAAKFRVFHIFAEPFKTTAFLTVFLKALVVAFLAEILGIYVFLAITEAFGNFRFVFKAGFKLVP